MIMEVQEETKSHEIRVLRSIKRETSRSERECGSNRTLTWFSIAVANIYIENSSKGFFPFFQFYPASASSCRLRMIVF